MRLSAGTFLCYNANMTIEIAHETEIQLVGEARRRGVSVDTLLKHFINERATLAHSAPARPDLPVWHLGSMGALRRRDIYDDVR